MVADLVARLHTLDLAILADVVRRDQGSASFEISDWSLRRLSDRGVMNPDGLWLVSGHGHAGGSLRPWSVVVKVFVRPDPEVPPESRFSWNRELLVAQSGLLDRLTGAGVRPPRFYRVDEHADGAWLWMEHVVDDRSTAWALDDYAFAARHLGRWNGRCLRLPRPTEPWLAQQHYREWLGVVDPDTDWHAPLHQKHIAAQTRRRFARLWADRELFYRSLERVPQGFAHFDGQRRNLLIQRGAHDPAEVVLLDWALCGVGAVGAEVAGLVGASALMLEWPSTAIAALDATAFPNYLQGLREAGWAGDPKLVRLAYVAWLAIYWGAIMPYGMTNWFCSPESRARDIQLLGIAEEDLYVQWLPLLDYWLDCADEARVLMEQAGLR